GYIHRLAYVARTELEIQRRLLAYLQIYALVVECLESRGTNAEAVNSRGYAGKQVFTGRARTCIATRAAHCIEQHDFCIRHHGSRHVSHYAAEAASSDLGPCLLQRQQNQNARPDETTHPPLHNYRLRLDYW